MKQVGTKVKIFKIVPQKFLNACKEMFLFLVGFWLQGRWVKSQQNNKFVFWGPGYLTGSWCIGYFGFAKEIEKKRNEMVRQGVYTK